MSYNATVGLGTAGCGCEGHATKEYILVDATVGLGTASVAVKVLEQLDLLVMKDMQRLVLLKLQLWWRRTCMQLSLCCLL